MPAALTATGLTIEDLDAIESRLRSNAKQLFGAHANVTGSSLLAKLISLMAASEADLQELIAAVYNASYPNTASGVALRNLVQIGGVTAKDATKSTATVEITATGPGTVPQGAVIALQPTGERFALLSAVVFAAAGTQSANVQAIEAGAVEVPAGSLTKFEDGALDAAYSADNAAPGATGTDAESDEDLRNRFFASYHLPGTSSGDGLRAELLAVDGVTTTIVYENDTNAVISARENQPPHSVFCIVIGGTDDDVAQAIWDSKALGIEAYGGTTPATGTATKAGGSTLAVKFDRPTSVTVYIELSFTGATGNADTIKAAVEAYGATLKVGGDVLELAVLCAAIDALDSKGDGFGLTAKIDTVAPPTATGNLTINFNALAAIAAVNISVLGL